MTYVGRIVAIGNTHENKLTAIYRVSTRSFPNRKAVQIGEAIAIVPQEGFEKDVKLSPFITYNCLRTNPRYAVATNGTQTDPIFEKLSDGVNVRDALTSVLLGLDYEHDQLKTPRIAAVVDLKTRSGSLGIIRHDAILIRAFQLKKGEVFYLATYEHNYPDDRFTDTNFKVVDAAGACDYILGKGIFSTLDLPVTATAAIESESGFQVAYKNL
jgi:IMP cyclohydrolase